MEIVTADIGGTHARFAIATLESGRVTNLTSQFTLKSADYPDLPSAWAGYAAKAGHQLPRRCAIAIAAPLGGETVKFTNLPWTLEPARLAAQLNVEHLTLINDFGAVGHAVQQCDADSLAHCCGPRLPLSEHGATTILGPGTGLGVACLLRIDDHYHVIETEGAHIDFAPRDEVDDMILAALRRRHGRVSIERVVSGQGLVVIHDVLADIEGLSSATCGDIDLWTQALNGENTLATAALERFCFTLGAVAGDFALAHGASGVVVAGGLGARIGARLADTGFYDGFVAKGRYQAMMEHIPVKLLIHEQPGLFGAAAAFAHEHGG